MKQLLAIRLADENAERVRKSHAEAIGEWQGSAAAGLKVIAGIQLADGVNTPIPHGLGRAARWVAPSAVRGASTTGRIEEVRDSVYDRERVVVLKATDWGATVTVDVLVC